MTLSKAPEGRSTYVLYSSHLVALLELGELGRQVFDSLVHESVEALQLLPIEAGTIVERRRLPPGTGQSARQGGRMHGVTGRTKCSMQGRTASGEDQHSLERIY